MAVLERPGFSLWSRQNAEWFLLDTSANEAELRLKAESLRRLFTTRQFLVLHGTTMPEG
jgi:hypothetical protein